MTLVRFMAITPLSLGVIDSLRVVAVEGNPDSAAYIELNANKDAKFSVVAKVLGKEERRDRYLVKGFRFIPSGSPKFLLIACACS